MKARRSARKWSREICRQDRRESAVNDFIAGVEVRQSFHGTRNYTVCDRKRGNVISALARPRKVSFPINCQGGDSNPYGFLHQILSLARLPISPPWLSKLSKKTHAQFTLAVDSRNSGASGNRCLLIRISLRNTRSYSALIKLISPLRSRRATSILERSSVFASSRISSWRSCSEMWFQNMFLR